MKTIPLNSLVVLVGPSGSGKSTLCEKHFPKYEIISSDAIREELVGEPNRQDISSQAFEEVRRRAEQKLALGERAVIDSTNIKRQDRMTTAQIGINLGVPVVYLVWNRPLEEKKKTAGWRHGVIVRGKSLIEAHDATFVSNEKDILNGDGLPVTVIDARTEEFTVSDKPDYKDLLGWIRKGNYTGLAVVGDVHNMSDKLLEAIDYAEKNNLFMVFLGDIIDYGPDPVGCVDMIFDLVLGGRALMIHGNHEKKYWKVIQQLRQCEEEGIARSEDNIHVHFTFGTRDTFDAVECLERDKRVEWERKFETLFTVSRHHIRIGNITFVHGAFHPDMLDRMDQHRLMGRLGEMAMFGQTDGTFVFSEKFGREVPNRTYKWTDTVPAHQIVMVGHDYSRTSPEGKPDIVTNERGGKTMFVDTGCGKDGPLSLVVVPFTGNNLLKWSEIITI